MKNETKLSIETMKFWPMETCWDCGEFVDTKDCWYKFVRIGKEMFNVPQCDECIKKEDQIFTKEGG